MDKVDLNRKWVYTMGRTWARQACRYARLSLKRAQTSDSRWIRASWANELGRTLPDLEWACLLGIKQPMDLLWAMPWNWLKRWAYE